MKRNELEIEISSDGNTVSVHIQGVKGKQCLDATEFLEKGLGTVLERTKTQEYHQQPDKTVVNVGFTKGK